METKRLHSTLDFQRVCYGGEGEGSVSCCKRHGKICIWSKRWKLKRRKNFQHSLLVWLHADRLWGCVSLTGFQSPFHPHQYPAYPIKRDIRHEIHLYESGFKKPR